MNLWYLPQTKDIGGVEYSLSTDFRDILEIIEYFNNSTKPEYIRVQIALALFYNGDIPPEYQAEAFEYLSTFIDYGVTDKKQSPKLIDWELDAQMIVSDVNKVAGTEIRAIPYLHWWTFLSYFYAIGEGQLSTVVSIRSKKLKGKKLDDWEKEYYRENRNVVDFKAPNNPEKEAMQKYFDKWL